MRDPTYYCVQTICRDGPRLVNGRLWHYPSASEACAAAELAARRNAGAVAFEVVARPEYGIWGDPRILAEHGEVPRS